jgi:hypothetical protein
LSSVEQEVAKNTKQRIYIGKVVDYHQAYDNGGLESVKDGVILTLSKDNKFVKVHLEKLGADEAKNFLIDKEVKITQTIRYNQGWLRDWTIIDPIGLTDIEIQTNNTDSTKKE